MADYDLVIRHGTIIDGSGAAAFRADVAVSGDRIAAIGTVTGTGREEIDATGKLVTPGFVDIHTHFDGQVTWANELSPASQHGVTTVLMGNCGVGFAPCRPQERQMLLDLMEGVEDIPQAVMEEGIPWNWETFPEYLDAIDQREMDVDFGVMIAHGPVRIYTMGRRGAQREPASQPDVERMAAIVKEAVEAGAFGFSTTRSLNNRNKDGTLNPTITAREDELKAMATAMGETGRGLIELNDQWLDIGPDGSDEFDMIARVAKAAGRPVSFQVAQEKNVEKIDWVMNMVERANADGVTVRAQVVPRPIGILLGLDCSINPFTFCPSWTEVADLPLEEKVDALKDPALRARLVSEEAVSTNPFYLGLTRAVVDMAELGDPPNYSPGAEDMIGERARREGKTALELAYDLMLKDGGRNILYFPVVNFTNHNLDHMPALLRHPHSLIGLGDAGAHVGFICDASITTHLLTYWTRDREGERLELADAVHRLTLANAEYMGLKDRGVVRQGFKADLNVIDYDRLQLRAPRAVFDLPSGARRMLQDAEGYLATIKSGQIIYREGKPTGAKPGRLLRGPQPLTV